MNSLTNGIKEFWKFGPFFDIFSDPASFSETTSEIQYMEEISGHMAILKRNEYVPSLFSYNLYHAKY
jgi:hypothetical protein